MAITKKIVHWFYRLSWTKIIGLAFLVLTVVALPLAKDVATNPTRTRSEAALLPKPQPITQEFETPKGPPKIYLVDHFFGKTGDAVLIHGENLGGLHQNSWVSLNGKKISVDDLVSWTGNYIEFKVPNGAQSGIIEVSVLGQKASWQGIFLVINTTTETELKLEKLTDRTAQLKGKNLQAGQNLLIWLLVINGDDQLILKPASGINIEQTDFKLPIGKIYEIKLVLNSQVKTASRLQLADLLRIEKTTDLVVGIARGELSNEQGAIIPLKVSPLYVSF